MSTRIARSIGIQKQLHYLPQVTMYSIQHPSKILLVLCLVAVQRDILAHNELFIKDIAQQYLSSLNQQINLGAKPSGQQTTQKIRNGGPTDKETAEVLFSLFEESGISDQFAGKKYARIDKPTWERLRLFYGTSSKSNFHLVQQLTRNAPCVVKVMSMVHLVHPHIQKTSIEKNQQIIKRLMSHLALFQRLQKAYTKLAQLEPSLCSLFSPNEVLWSKNFQKKLQQDYFNYEGRFEDWYRTEIEKRLRYDFKVIFSIGKILAKLIVITTFLSIKTSSGDSQSNPKFRKFVEGDDSIKMSTNPIKATLWLLSSEIFGWVLYFPLYIYLIRKQQEATLHVIGEKLQSVHDFLLTALDISKAVKSDPVLYELCQNRLAYTEQIMYHRSDSKEVSNFVERFLTSDFLGWSFFKDYVATMLISMQMLRDQQHILPKMLFELGDLGTYVYLVPLLQSRQENRFSFVEIVDEEACPHLETHFEGIWNTDINADKAQPNDVHISTASHNKVFIKGANENGKTTYAFAIAKGLLLAQVYGIAPCKGGRIVPVVFFYAHKGITDDVKAGKSLYRAELDAFKEEYVDALMQLPKDAKSLAIFDEAFKSIPLDDSTAILFAMTEWTSEELPNHLTFLTSHNDFLNKESDKLDKVKILSVKIVWNEEGDAFERTFQITEDKEEDMVGIFLFKKAFPNLPIADEATKLMKKYYGYTPRKKYRRRFSIFS